MHDIPTPGKKPWQTHEVRTTWYLRVQGQCVECSRHLSHSQFKAGTTRDNITGMSKSSRMRMLRAVAKINWTTFENSLFITLTYPDQCIESSYRERTKHRYLFHRYIEKHLGRKIPAIWRVEWKPRRSGPNTGKLVPHLHLVVFGVRFIAHGTVRAWWRTILHAVGPLMTDVRKITGESSAAKYICKYVSKIGSLDYAAYLNNNVVNGRHWGFVRKGLIPVHDIAVMTKLTDVEVDSLKACALQAYPDYGKAFDGGFTLFGKHVAERLALEFENRGGHKPANTI